MDLLQLKNNIQENKLDKFYLFTGEETGIMNIYVDTIAKKLNLKVHRENSFYNIASELKNISLLDEPRLFYIYNDKDILKDDKFIETYIENSFINNGALILRFDEIDKRKKFFKDIDKYTVYFNKLDTNVLISYIDKRMKELPESVKRKIIEHCNNDYNRIQLELDKLELLDKYILPYRSDRRFFEAVVFNFLIAKTNEEVIFDIIDCIIKRDINISKRIEPFLNSSEYTLTIISLLLKQYKNILAIKGCTKKNITESTGINYYVYNKLVNIVNNYSIKKILFIIDLLRDIEMKIKTGKVDNKLAIEYILINIYI